MNFDFINDIEVAEPVKTVKTPSGVGTIPIDGHFRVLRNGSIVFTEQFAGLLTKVSGEDEVADRKWLDFVFSTDWPVYPQDKPAVCFLHINPFGKAAKADVKTEGTSTYIKNYFLEKAKELWNINWDETTYVDFKIEDVSMDIKIMHMPKIVQRGVDKGKPDYIRREDVTMSPISPTSDFAVMAPVDSQKEIEFEETSEESGASMKKVEDDDDIRKGM